MMILVLGVIALLIFIMIFSYTQGQSSDILGGIFDWFKILGGGA